MNSSLGFDIGGANIKVASSSGLSLHRSFPMWKQPEELGHELNDMLAHFPPAKQIAVTMTGELADCFESKQAGVQHIVDASCKSFGPETVFYQTTGQFVSAPIAIEDWQLTAAANWHALAAWVAKKIDGGFLIDIGSTTADLIPLLDGQPQSRGKTDLQRMTENELIYTGVDRSPVSCVIPSGSPATPTRLRLAQELFATMKDVYLILGQAEPDPNDFTTADGKPFTLTCSRQRIARLLCSDPAELVHGEIEQIAKSAAESQASHILTGLKTLMDNHTQVPKQFVVSGQGEWLGRQLVPRAVSNPGPIRSIRELLEHSQTQKTSAPLGGRHTTRLQANLSDCAPAFAVACQLEELNR